MNHLVNKAYRWSEWVMNLFLLQIYWLTGTLAGGVILGIMPSSIALFSAIRKLDREPQELKLHSYFINEYKANFKSSLFIGIWYLLAIALGFVYSQFLVATTDSWFAYTHILFYVLLILVFLLSLYLIPVYVHYEMPIIHLLPTSCIIMLSNMKWHLPLLLSLLAIGLVFIQFSVIFIFFGISLPAFITFYFSKRAFSDFDVKREHV